MQINKHSRYDFLYPNPITYSSSIIKKVRDIYSSMHSMHKYGYLFSKGLSDYFNHGGGGKLITTTSPPLSQKGL